MKTSQTLRIREISGDKEAFLDLLLIGDEQEDMIARYLSRGRLFVGETGEEAVAVCVVTMEEEGVAEVKNLAVRPEFQRRGHGSEMLRFVESMFPGCKLRLGTGETPSTLAFYHRCGFRYSHRVAGFFTDNYDHPIIEEGVLLTDMVYLEKELR